MSQIKKIVLYSMVLVSCSEEVSLTEIDFGNAELSYEIAIDGFITNEKEHCRIKVSKPVAVTSRIEEVPVEEAELILKQGNAIFKFEHHMDGIYISIDSIAAIAGEKYILEVNYQGKTYSAVEVMPEEPNDDFYIPFFYVSSYDDNQKPRPYDPSSVGLSIYIHNFGYEKQIFGGFNNLVFTMIPFPI